MHTWKPNNTNDISTLHTMMVHRKLRSELETLKMKPDESVSEFAGKLSSIQAKFKSIGGALKDKVLVRKLLNSVPKKFLPIVASIEQYQEIDTMQFEEAVGRITAFEERLKSQDEPEDNYQNKLLGPIWYVAILEL